MPLVPGPADLPAVAAGNALDVFSVGCLGGGSVLGHARPSSMKVRVSSSR